MKRLKLLMPLRDGRGFSLFELVAVIAIIGIVSALILATTHQVYSIYMQSEENWIVQQDVKNTISWVQSSLETAYLVDIYPDNSYLTDDDYYHIYYDASDRRSYYKEPGESAVKINESLVEVSFYYYKANEKALGIRVSGYGLRDTGKLVYSMDGIKAFQNMYRATYINMVNGKTTTGTVSSITGSEPPEAGEDTVGYAIAFKLSSAGLSEMIATTSGFCFIATAAYGSPMQPAVLLLRDFRDDVLLKSKAGSAFVNWYYNVSPPLADLISDSEPLRMAVRIALIPLLIIAVVAMFPQALAALLLSVFLVLYIRVRKNRFGNAINK